MRFVPALVGFPVLLGMAILQDWHAVDLVWAIWTSQMAVIAYAAFMLPFIDPDDLPARLSEDRGFPLLIVKHFADTAVSGFVGAAFFVMACYPLLFGPLSLLLNGLVPLLPPEMPGSRLSGFDTAVSVSLEACMRYWPAAVLCCVVQTPSVVRAMARKQPGGNKFALFLLREALTAGGVVLAGLVVVMLGRVLGKSVAGLADYILMALLLFPWAVLWARPTQEAEIRGSGATRTRGH